MSSVVAEVGLCIWMEHTDPCDMRTEELRLVRRRAIILVMASTGLPFELKPNPLCKWALSSSNGLFITRYY